MINPSELRIGNWVETYIAMLHGSWYDKEGKRHGEDVFEQRTVRQKQIDLEDFKILCRPQGFLATYRPIPLTPEILEKCGFERIGEWGKNIVVEFHGPQINPLFRFKMFSRHKIFRYHEHQYNEVILKSLHQLQNLYYALTGEELNYTP